jgi:hypothetical protein
LPGRHSERTILRSRDDSRVLASFWTSPLESGPFRPGPLLREHRMGGKGSRTRSVKSIADQSRRCVPNESRTGRESQSSTIKATRRRVRTPKAFAKWIRRF